MSWRLRVEHTTAFDYATPARSSYNEVRQTPVTTTHQTALEWRVTTTPHAAPYVYRDYWGTRVVSFNIDPPHRQLRIHSTSLVDTRPPPPVPQAGWDDVAAWRDRLVEFLEPSHYAQPAGDLEALGEALRRATPVATVGACVAWVHDALEYVPGVTHVRTPAAEAFAAGRGVCQDFAHLALAVLRTAGVPARYVSGYLHPRVDAQVGEAVTAESHAWIEAWTGEWWGVDPTNGVDAGVRHVVVARGRDYADVAPVRGIYAGGPEQGSAVTVTVTRAA